VEQTASWAAILSIVATLASSLAAWIGAKAYNQRKTADATLEVVKKDAQDAMDNSAQIVALTGAINGQSNVNGRLLEQLVKNDERAAEERRNFIRVMEANASAKADLKTTVDGQTAHIDANTHAIKALQDDTVAGRNDAVDKVNSAMNERFDKQDATLAAVTATLEEMRTEFNRKIDAILASLHASETPAPDVTAVIDTTLTVTSELTNKDIQVLAPVPLTPADTPTPTPLPVDKAAPHEPPTRPD
jgi:hypothetical protein